MSIGLRHYEEKGVTERNLLGHSGLIIKVCLMLSTPIAVPSEVNHWFSFSLSMLQSLRKRVF